MPPAPPSLKDLHHLGGTQDGHFFYITPEWVDKSKKPGFTPFPTPTFQDFVWNGIFQKHLLFSPNLVWLVITTVMYFAFPYDLSSSSSSASIAPVSKDFFLERFPLWFCLVFGYVAFWHITLHLLHWGDRPFVANRVYRLSKTLHNAFYTIIGIAVAVVIENIFCFLYATGRLEYWSDSEIKSSPTLHLSTFLWISITPLWRDFHFYFAHRLIHYNALYRYIHSLHHRNTDVEPFSGLSMHPIEHLLYYASYGPLLLVKVSPFVMLWNLAHLVLAPAASHSGEESSWQSDSFHYLHHRFFTYNYAGLGASFLDNAFGSFLARWPEQQRQQQQQLLANAMGNKNQKNQQQQRKEQAEEQQQQDDEVSASATSFSSSSSASYSEQFLTLHDAKATLWGFPSIDVVLYNIFGVGAVVVGLAGACGYKEYFFLSPQSKLRNVSSLFYLSDATIFAWILCGFGPILIACALNALFAKNFRERTANDKSTLHFLIHFSCGLLCCPVSFAYLVSLCF